MKHVYELLHAGYFAGCNEKGLEKRPNTKAIDKEHTHLLSEIHDAPNILGLLNPEIVMVDFDDTTDAQAFERIMTALKIKAPVLTTTRGKHFYFKRNSNCPSAITNTLLACGLKADFKLGNKHGLDLIKYQGQWRKLENTTALLTELPDFCKPLTDNEAKTGQSLAYLHKGSRNDTLFSWNGRLLRAGLTPERAQYIIRSIINPFVLPEPLPVSQVRTVTRDEVYETAYKATKTSNEDTEKTPNPNEFSPYFSGHTFLFNKVAEELIANKNIIKIDTTLYYYDSRVYKIFSEDECNRLTAAFPCVTTTAQRREVLGWLDATAPQKSYNIDSDPNLNLIPFNNGIFDLSSMSFIEKDDPTKIIFNQIPHDYNPNAHSELAEQFFDRMACGSDDIKLSFFEMIGHCFYRRNVLRGCFMLVGEKRNGKSTFFKLLRFILGKGNVSSLKMHQIEERFMTGDLQNKLANIGDDIAELYIEDANNLKSAATSDEVVVEKKHVQPYKITPYATLIFSANNLPRISDATGAMLDRITIIPCNAHFDPSEPNYDPKISDKLLTEEVAQYCILKGLQAFKDAMVRGSLSLGSLARSMVEDYGTMNNPILSFIKCDYPALGGDIAQLDGMLLSEAYSLYTQYCEDEHIKLTSKQSFVRKMKAAVQNLTTFKTTMDGTHVTKFVKINPSRDLVIK